VVTTRRAIAFLTLVAAACGDDTEAPVVDVPDVVVRVDDEPAGDRCAHGGQAVSSGLDADRDGVLDDAEIAETRYVCSEPEAAALVRRDLEPAGANCERGGTVIRSGVDRDRDGALADAEVTATTYVCKDALLLPLHRVDREPVDSEHCPTGGAAVHGGIDRDGDLVLDDAEIDATSYVCDDVALTRVVTEPSGASCRAGGVAVHSGADRDHDGVLDDAEISDTDYVCGTVIQGAVLAISQSQINELRDVEAITGDLTIHFAGAIQSLQLPSLRVVGGTLSIHFLNHATRVELPQLRSVAGTLRVSAVAQLSSLDLSALQVAGAIEIRDNPTLRSLRLPGVTELRGNLTVRGNPLTELDLSNLQSVAGLTLANLRVDGIALPNLRQVGSVAITASTSASLSAPALRTALGGVSISGLAQLRTLALTALTTVERDLIVRDLPQLTELALPALETLGGSLDVASHAALAQLSAPRLPAVGSLLLTGNPALATVALPALASVRDQLQLRGNRAMAELAGLSSLRAIGGAAEIGDTRLTRLALPSLATIGVLRVGRADPTPVLDNPLLETIELPGLREAGALAVMAAPLLTRLELPALDVVRSLFQVGNAPGLRRCELEALVGRLAVPPDEVTLVGVGDAPCP
jgi:hypothetical protein